MKVTCKDGPLDGKNFEVPAGSKTLQHHAVSGGHYRIRGKVATWTPDKGGHDDTTPPTGGE